MSNRLRLHSLLAHFALRVIAPLTLVMVVMIAAGLYAYQQTITSLLIDRDQQLAVLSAAQLSEAMAGYARELGKPAQIPFVAQNVKLGLKPVWSRGPLTASGLLEIFTAGVVAVNAEGQVVDVTPWSISSPVGETVAEQDYFRSVHQHLTPIFSDVVIDTRTGQNMIVIAMPILDDQKEFVGALLGAVDLRNTALSEPINNLRIGDGGIAYLVDGTGRVIFHPDASRIGADFGDRPFVENVIAGKSGGTLWRVPTTGRAHAIASRLIVGNGSR